jgi:hypothetical protein
VVIFSLRLIYLRSVRLGVYLLALISTQFLALGPHMTHDYGKETSMYTGRNDDDDDELA